ncbi:biotin biosynthesis bifunctional protein BioHC-like [Amphiura filiformis]|uniref:biotin biosynthesis bifunctional protein BioHC-like n=1 Tax=Amphiura filiformis TaxID=82378 RepID=UPI003B21F521
MATSDEPRLEDQHGSERQSRQSNNDQRRLDLDQKIRQEILRLGDEGTPEELRDFYNKHVEEYYELSELHQYSIGCRALIESLAEVVPDRSLRILDIGAGTGYAGKELRRLGYDNIDALDPAEGLLDIAKSQNIYQKYFLSYIFPDKKTIIEDDSYDAACMAGAVVKGHITMDCLPELMRITKKGGVIIFNIGEHYLKPNLFFKFMIWKNAFRRL